MHNWLTFGVLIKDGRHTQMSLKIKHTSVYFTDIEQKFDVILVKTNYHFEC